MEFEWDAEKSAKVKAERGASFEELQAAINEGGLLAVEKGNDEPEQFLFIVNLEGKIWCVVVERRVEALRIVTAYQSRKWRKKYGF